MSKCNFCFRYLTNNYTLACSCGTFCSKRCLDLYHQKNNKQHVETTVINNTELNTLNKKITPADFNQEDINEVSAYLNNAVGFSEVLTRFYTLTDKVIDKAKVFLGVYRVLSSACNYTENKDLKEKLTTVLENTKNLYYEISVINNALDNTKVNYGMHVWKYKLDSILLDTNNFSNINIVIDLFILFAEKQIKYNLNKITGVDLETPEDREIMKEIYASSKDSPVNDTLIKEDETKQNEEINEDTLIEQELDTENIEDKQETLDNIAEESK